MDQCKALCPVDRSGQVQTCELNAEICLETDGCASSPSVENGTILGNIYLEGSKLKVACNHGYEPLPGMAISQCVNGTWTNALKCGLVCDTGWEQNGTSLYCFTKITGNFTFAKAVCAEIGAEILNVEDESEQSYLQGKLQAVFGLIRFVCLGMEKDYNMLWRYSTALEEVTYFNWGPGEPDDFPEDLCAVMFGYSPGWQWADISCSRDCRLVCERAI